MDGSIQVLETQSQTILVEESQSSVIIAEGSGIQGPPGPSGTLTVSQVSTLSPTSPVQIQNVGTPQNAILNIGIPQGVKGDKGEPGDATWETEFIDVTSQIKADKKVVMAKVRKGNENRVEVAIQGYSIQYYGTDFYVVGQEVRWDLCAMELLIDIGDKLRIQYPI
ncbi:MAG: hypothetical protein ACXVCY_04625 [Pseudobdellovibrionaceae bacterium]